VKKILQRWKLWIVLVFVGMFGYGFYLVAPFLPKLPAFIDIQCSRKRSYNPGNCFENLKSLSQALKFYLEANDSYPPKEVWMDELSKYLRAADLPAKEQEKKLKCPDLAASDASAYGYAYNGQISEKWSDEVPNPKKIPAIYDSKKTERNAYDEEPFASLPNPPRHGGNNVIWADGHVSEKR